ncbi:unnamed protein product [Blepharisma stoltei]|uniref:Uncharacterized protein n=1 Tax=Blepharisma stoltei TaxID=1481888 RepID=A0AAU9IUK8_9CILI|nr:unnamed protein product [Blepharisma stoltei]
MECKNLPEWENEIREPKLLYWYVSLKSLDKRATNPSFQLQLSEVWVSKNQACYANGKSANPAVSVSVSNVKQI